MLMILARLVRSESFWAVVKVRSPHNGPEVWYPRIVLRRFGVAAAGPQLLRLCRGAPACAADHRKSAFAASRPRHDGGLGVLLLPDGYSCLRSRLVAPERISF